MDPPATPEELTVDHLERYWRQRHAEVKQRGLVHEVRAVGRVVGEMPAGMIAEDVDAWLHRRRSAGQNPAIAGYSDREFDAIMAAARSDVAAIRSRLERSQRLLTRYEREPDSLSGEERQLAAVLADIAATGEIPVIGHDSKAWDNHPMMTAGTQLFVTGFDLGPLLTLGVGISGRNWKPSKTSPSSMTCWGQGGSGGADETPPGPHRMFETVHWEIGHSSQQLRRPAAITCCWSR